ncbi:MAG: hypothetical protein KGL35_20830 [Bradyrhizobium sp.]|nr:hypothetical protein [Bradyrhizobium sp.]
MSYGRDIPLYFAGLAALDMRIAVFELVPFAMAGTDKCRSSAWRSPGMPIFRAILQWFRKAT